MTLRSDNWQVLCEAVQGFQDLSNIAKLRVAWTLIKLGFHRSAIKLVGATRTTNWPDEERASLEFVLAYARYRMNVDDSRSPYSIKEFEKVAVESPPGIVLIDATYQVVVQNAKHTGDLQQVILWQSKHLEAISRSRMILDDFTNTFVMSRYHRVGGFIPQMKRDSDALIHEMGLAEQFAGALPRRTDMLRIAADEVMYPVLESRVKEALWLGDNDLALARAIRLTKLSPNDARAWLEQGEVLIELENYAEALRCYMRANSLAPPGREIAMFMAGQCYEALDDLESACEAYLDALTIDPLGISAAEQLLVVTKQLGRATLNTWVSSRLEELRRMEAESRPPRLWAHKQVPAPAAI